MGPPTVIAALLWQRAASLSRYPGPSDESSLLQVVLSHGREDPTSYDLAPTWTGCYFHDNEGEANFSERVEMEGPTPQSCMEACLEKSRLYFALQDSGGCYCGQPKVDVKSLRVAHGEKCGNPCKGDEGHFCGDHRRRAVYQASKLSTTWAGCYKDNATQRGLPVRQSGANFTARGCMRACAGYQYMALQSFGKNCFCGNAYQTDEEMHAKLKPKKCGPPCAGEGHVRPTRPCGKKWANAIFNLHSHALASAAEARATALPAEASKSLKTLDADGDGVLTRKEIAIVLMEVDPSKWSAFAITQLIRALDANGDHQLQYDEYTPWLNSARDLKDLGYGPAQKAPPSAATAPSPAAPAPSAQPPTDEAPSPAEAAPSTDEEDTDEAAPSSDEEGTDEAAPSSGEEGTDEASPPTGELSSPAGEEDTDEVPPPANEVSSPTVAAPSANEEDTNEAPPPTNEVSSPAEAAPSTNEEDTSEVPLPTNEASSPAKEEVTTSEEDAGEAAPTAIEDGTKAAPLTAQQAPVPSQTVPLATEQAPPAAEQASVPLDASSPQTEVIPPRTEVAPTPVEHVHPSTEEAALPTPADTAAPPARDVPVPSSKPSAEPPLNVSNDTWWKDALSNDTAAGNTPSPAGTWLDDALSDQSKPPDISRAPTETNATLERNVTSPAGASNDSWVKDALEKAAASSSSSNQTWGEDANSTGSSNTSAAGANGTARANATSSSNSSGGEWWKEAVGNVVATNLKKFDINGDNIISKSELSMTLMGVDPEKWTALNIQLLMYRLDANSDRKLEYDEYAPWLSTIDNLSDVELATKQEVASARRARRMMRKR